MARTLQKEVMDSEEAKKNQAKVRKTRKLKSR
jgi:hypothetical protein